MSSEADIKILSEETIATLQEMLGDDLISIIAEFIQSTPEQVRMLKNSGDCSDVESVTSITHSIKGSSGSIGAIYLSDKCQVLESGLRENVIQDTEKYIREIELALDVTLSELKKRFNEWLDPGT